jgi:hypothetical protein
MITTAKTFKATRLIFKFQESIVLANGAELLHGCALHGLL